MLGFGILFIIVETFKKTTALLFEDGKVFENFYDLSKWLYKRSESTYKISLDRMAEFLFEYMSKNSR